MRPAQTRAVVALATAFAVPRAGAACLTEAEVDALAQAIAAKTPAATPEGLSDADAACTRAALNQRLAARYGAVAGYKAGLTNAAVQKRFNYDKPVWGVLYQGMLLARTPSNVNVVEKLAAINQQHRLVYEAIVARDIDSARHAMRDHLVRCKRSTSQWYLQDAELP